MPSVCKISEKVSVAESEASLTPYKACISALDKKLRNLEKRKVKLDSYREKLTRGEKLDKDQKEAVDKYESVTANLEFARELHKMYQTMSDEADKVLEKSIKKQAKKEKLERQQLEFDRMSDAIKLQSLMLSVGTDEVREDLLSGKYGGVTLTEQNLTQLDEFYQLISPSTEDNTSFTEQLSAATEHLLSYIDKVDKPVVGTTYQALHEIIDRLLNAGFFDAASGQPVVSTEQVERTVTDTCNESNVVAKQDEVLKSGILEQEPASDVLAQPEQTQEGSYETLSLPESTSHLLQSSVEPDASNITWYQSSTVATTGPMPSVEAMTADNQARLQRPLQDIVSSLQGNYNFLQESEIDDQSFERVNFMAQPESSYTFVNQQMALQHGGSDLGQFGANSGAQPNGGFVPAHHHQEPGFVVVSHDSTMGEMQYPYAANPSGFLGPVMSADVASQQSSGFVQSKPVGDSSVKRVGGGDAQDALRRGVSEMTVGAHQGHGAVYGPGRGGRGGAVYSGRGGASRAGNMPNTGGHNLSAGGRGGKSR